MQICRYSVPTRRVLLFRVCRNDYHGHGCFADGGRPLCLVVNANAAVFWFVASVFFACLLLLAPLLLLLFRLVFVVRQLEVAIDTAAGVDQAGHRPLHWLLLGKALVVGTGHVSMCLYFLSVSVFVLVLLVLVFVVLVAFVAVVFFRYLYVFV